MEIKFQQFQTREQEVEAQAAENPKKVVVADKCGLNWLP
jgi:hypothetical protein